MKLFNSMPIGRKLTAFSCLLIVLAIVATSAMNFFAARDALLTQTEKELRSIAKLQSERVFDFFTALDRDLTLRAEDTVVADALQAFSKAFAEYADPKETLQRVYIHDNPHPNGEKDNLTTAGTNQIYDWTHTKYHPYFNALQDSNGYYDVFLFDTQGNLVYSVFKELDYATNLDTGEWRDTGLARVFRAANVAEPGAATIFDDFTPYGPSYGAAAAFFARPVFLANGERVGVLAYQAPIDAINRMMSSISGVSGLRDALLIGPDGLYRNDSPVTEEDDVLNSRMDTEFVADGFSGGSGFLSTVSDEGEQLLTSYLPVDVFGTTWVVVANETTHALDRAVSDVLTRTALVAALALGLAILFMILLSRSVSRPLTEMSKAVEAISEKKFDTHVPATHRGDEIGLIAGSIENFRIKLKTTHENMRDVASKSTAFEISGAPMLIADLDFTILQINSALDRMMHERAEDFRLVAKDFDPDRLVGMNMDSFHAIPAAARKKLSDTARLPFKTKIAVGNAYVGLLVDAIRDIEGEHIGYIVDWKDQTLQMENQVVMNTIDRGQGRIELGLDGVVRKTNQTFADWVGCEPAALVGLDMSSALTREIAAEGSSDIWEDAGKDSGVFDRFRLQANGHEIIVDGCLAPMPDHKQVTKGYLLLGTDVTEARKAAIAAEERQDEMTRAQMDVVDAFQNSLAMLSDGDLTASIDAGFAEDYETLRANYNAALSSLRGAFSDVLDATASIRNDAREVRSATDELSKRTEQQAATLEETSAALAELTASVKSSSDGAAKASQVVIEARRNAEESGAVVRDAVAAMTEIESSSQSISNIISVIDDIAFQTNLLALNAGVEAARAGDAGRGFAVVASEVRGLAQRASEAAREITQLINSSGEQVEKGASLVQKAGQALTEIVESVQDISNHVTSIANSAAEQSAGLNEINDAISELDGATQHNTAMVEETTATSESLSAQSERLSETTARFRTQQTGKGIAPVQKMAS